MSRFFQAILLSTSLRYFTPDFEMGNLFSGVLIWRAKFLVEAKERFSIFFLFCVTKIYQIKIVFHFSFQLSRAKKNKLQKSSCQAIMGFFIPILFSYWLFVYHLIFTSSCFNQTSLYI